jgi:molybdopterin-guanine dinucleotide biosynthesis protein A
VTLTEIGTSAWCATSNVVEVGFEDEPEAFSNINTREELHTWENAPLA